MQKTTRQPQATSSSSSSRMISGSGHGVTRGLAAYFANANVALVPWLDVDHLDRVLSSRPSSKPNDSVPLEVARRRSSDVDLLHAIQVSTSSSRFRSSREAALPCPTRVTRARVNYIDTAGSSPRATNDVAHHPLRLFPAFPFAPRTSPTFLTFPTSLVSY